MISFAMRLRSSSVMKKQIKRVECTCFVFNSFCDLAEIQFTGYNRDDNLFYVQPTLSMRENDCLYKLKGTTQVPTGPCKQRTVFFFIDLPVNSIAKQGRIYPLKTDHIKVYMQQCESLRK